MRALLVAVLLSAGAGAAGALQSPQVAHACSCADCDPVADAPVIVGGWIESWSEHPAAQFVPPGFMAITTDLRVAQVFKGQIQSTVEVVDHASLSVAPPGWFGGSGACGSFDEDPKGKYVILGLSTYEPDPSLMASNRIWLFYIGDAPQGEAYERALERLAPLGPPAPPAVGNSSTTGADDLPVLAVSLFAISRALSALWVARRR